MSTENNLNQTQEKSLLQLQLEELVKVGVGGKFKNQSDYLEKIKEELEFEEAMLRGGIDRYRKSVNEAKYKHQESTTLYGLVYQQKYIVHLSQMINEDVKQMNNGSAGNYQTALKLICQCLPPTSFENGVFIDDRPMIWDSCSLIVLKNAIDGISDETTLNKLSIQIGTGLMHEARITKFKYDNYKEFKQVEKRLTGKNIPQNANRYQYKQKVWTYCMNKHQLAFDDWSKEGRLHLGVKMISYLEKLGLVRHQNRKLNKMKTVTYVEATPKIIEEIKNFNIRNEALFPKYLPMKMQPRDWESPFIGGYYGRKFNETNKAEDVAKSLYKNL
jgi:DNA-directed RNA polymerase, mitochondrial